MSNGDKIVSNLSELLGGWKFKFIDAKGMYVGIIRNVVHLSIPLFVKLET
jgi:hypothetical protein